MPEFNIYAQVGLLNDLQTILRKFELFKGKQKSTKQTLKHQWKIYMLNGKYFCKPKSMLASQRVALTDWNNKLKVECLEASWVELSTLSWADKLYAHNSIWLMRFILATRA